MRAPGGAPNEVLNKYQVFQPIRAISPLSWIPSKAIDATDAACCSRLIGYIGSERSRDFNAVIRDAHESVVSRVLWLLDGSAHGQRDPSKVSQLMLQYKKSHGDREHHRKKAMTTAQLPTYQIFRGSTKPRSGNKAPRPPFLCSSYTAWASAHELLAVCSVKAACLLHGRSCPVVWRGRS